MIEITQPIVKARVKRPEGGQLKCDQCGEQALVKLDGCYTCTSCGSSACGI